MAQSGPPHQQQLLGARGTVASAAPLASSAEASGTQTSTDPELCTRTFRLVAVHMESWPIPCVNQRP
eukprot:10156557-Alexandrium_andersonii.AAC.1